MYHSIITMTSPYNASILDSTKVRGSVDVRGRVERVC